MTTPIMRRVTGLRAAAILTLTTSLLATPLWAEPSHGIAMYGDPALAADFTSLPYVNADAPKGGALITGEGGSFDSLNPFITKGSAPWQLRFMMAESLMYRNWDEPFTEYGLLASAVETGPNREWVEFTLRPEAAFSDGSPLSVADVIFSHELLGTVGSGRYRSFYDAVASVEQTGENKVKFTFNTDNRELALLAGLRPILSKAQWEGKEEAFSESGFDNIPLTSAPYVIDDFKAGSYVSLKRNPDYWGRDLPVMQGLDNFDEIRWEFFADSSLVIEAFKAGELNSHREFNAQTWEQQYDYPAVTNGAVIKDEIAHQRPSGMTGFVFNTRKPQLADWRVRQALINLFNFEYINEVKNGSKQPRITSYFSNSPLAMSDGPAQGRVLDLLTPYRDDLLPGALEGYALPASDGSQSNRSNLRAALKLFEEAGYTVENGVMTGADGAPFTFEILLKSGDGENGSIIDLYVEQLAQAGITPKVTTVDPAQYEERLAAFDFGLTDIRRGLSLSPGTEQMQYWGSAAADSEGSRNLMGAKSPAIDGLIDTLVSAQSNEDFVAATKALDRVLTTGRYAIPIYQWNVSWIAHDSALHYPDTVPIYGDWIMWQTETWWSEK
ncbi:Oligopeptide-binding protein AppA precursor [Aquimixticola soesokkakensis]|uniref:Oligopeptide-binding protein AppA n=1 Tax=Aquimixticola soesokkakensis TaxID=1519096 RepID=A0A1Y5SIF0_9RHOB|nr:extracellular solute-binding protein [Aquimixticola soesokkakensis]SLN40853.1 Oligopeptide-binding protein AppA precursor [Aquimixticola soesokkakensis]